MGRGESQQLKAMRAPQATGWLGRSLITREVVTELSLAGSNDYFLKKEGCACAGRDTEILWRL